MTKPERYWKVLNAQGESCHGGSYRWSLPTWDAKRGWIPGAWTPLIENVVPCERGYHVCRDRDLLHWLGARIYACEVRGEIVEAEDNVVAGQVRLTCPTPWDDVSARLFAVECAAEVLPLYERAQPGDSQVSDCLVVAFRYALGDATAEELNAASAAAWDESAAASAASAAAAEELNATRAAAMAAEKRAAASAAVWDAAWAAARAAQTRRLLWWMGAEEET